jgi:glycosyltransferase involved in cell wall biosynthesis
MQRMNKKIEVTVIIPVKDVDQYLSQAISSVLNQESAECTVVVVDAGSAKPIIISEPYLSDSRVQLIRSNTPLTAGGARNMGLTYCKTEYLAFLDADDLWPLDRTKLMLSKFEHSKVKVVVGLVQNFSSDTTNQRLKVDQNIKTALLAGGILMKREILEEVGIFDPTLQSGEFIDWFQRIKSAGIICGYIDHIVLQRRIHSESTTARQIHDRPDYLKVVRKWMIQKN